MTPLQIIWFVLIGGMLAVYVVLDGADLGVGFWHMTRRDPGVRKALRAAIAPYWDGNEVWLIAAGALLFAAFPNAYAAVLSAFYLPLTLLLASLILRAVSIEFCEQDISDRWRSAWERAFGIGSTVAAFAFGFAAGNLLHGLPLDRHGNFAGSFADLLNPYSAVVGAAGMSMMVAHSLYYAQARLGAVLGSGKLWGVSAGVLALTLYLVAVVLTITGQGHLMSNYRSITALWALPILGFLLLALAAASNALGSSQRAFALSCAGIAVVFAALGCALFPTLIPSASPGAEALTIANSSSSPLTLGLMLAVTLTGLALVVAYTLWVRKRFRGTVDSNLGY